MGNLQSIHNMYNMSNMSNATSNTNTHSDNCLVCWEIIQKHNLVSCSRCNIQMHDFCYVNYNKIKNYNYCICPHCQRVGTLGQELWHKQMFEKSSKNY